VDEIADAGYTAGYEKNIFGKKEKKEADSIYKKIKIPKKIIDAAKDK
jgi:hypothetical protein